MEVESAEVAKRRFGITRKGYDPGQVSEYLQRVGMALAKWEATARSAEARTAQLERDLRDLQAMSENGFHQLVASNTLAEQRRATAPRQPATTPDAERIVTAANDHAVRVRHQAEAALEDALATTAMIEDDQQRLLDQAKSNRARLLAEAAARADQIVREAKEVAAKTRADAQRFAEELRELTAAETIELVGYAKEMAATILAAAGGDHRELVDDDLMIDLREPAEVDGAEDETQPREGLGGIRPSRYKAQSANLPQIGDDGANDAIDSVESLRENRES